MSSALRRLAQQAPQFTKGFSTSGAAKGGIEKYSHQEVVLGECSVAKGLPLPCTCAGGEVNCAIFWLLLSTFDAFRR